MKIAVISDIHSNFFYFKKVIEDIKMENVNKIFCLGDLIGYYDEPNEVIELLIKNNIYAVKGNHEKYFIGELSYNKSKEPFYRINEQLKIIKLDYIDFIKGLPDKLEIELCGKKLIFTHSLPNDCEKYLYNIDEMDISLLNKFDIYFYGHTHIPLIKCHKGTYIINPGSVGQPRDWSCNPHYVIVDICNLQITLKTIVFEKKEYIKNLQSKNFKKKVIDILIRKRKNVKN